MKDINKLSTESVDYVLNNLWVICGTPVDCMLEYRIVKMSRLLMSQVIV